MPTAEEIIAKVETKRLSTQPLRNRMANDYLLWVLQDFTWDEKEDSADNPYQTYTSNEPRLLADKVISFMVDADLIVTVPQTDKSRDDRDDDLAKEHFVLGIFEQADEFLLNMAELPVRDQLAWFGTVRGWIAGRMVFVKETDEDDVEHTLPDITPWDPLHTYFEPGGRRGFEWACHVTKKTAAEIKSEWGVEVEKKSAAEDLFGTTVEDTYDVYDYFDRDENTVVVETNQVLKKSTTHGSPRTPCFCIPVTGQPYIQGVEGEVEVAAHVGESVFAADRGIYEKVNRLLSTWLELVDRSKNPPIVYESEGGEKTLEENPWEAGSEVSIAKGEKLSALDLLEMSKDTGALFGLISSELQRGGLPNVAFGELQFQLSGYAIGNLGHNIESVLAPRIRALKDAYRMIGEIATDTFATGSFRAIEVSGRTRSREYFSETIDAEQIKRAGRLVYDLVPNLPRDEIARWNMAQMARDPGANGVPLAPDEWIRENILGIQDADGLTDRVLTQVAQRGLPQAQLFTLMEAAANAGQEQIAQFYMGELLKLVFQAMNPTPQLGAGAGPGAGVPGQVPPGLAAQIDPRALTPAAQGIPPGPSDESQLGLTVAPGTPRPGATLVGPDGVTPLI